MSLFAKLALDYHFGRPMKPWVRLLIGAALRNYRTGGTPQRKFPKDADHQPKAAYGAGLRNAFNLRYAARRANGEKAGIL